MAYREHYDKKVRLAVLGGFCITVDGRQIAIPPSVQRVLACLALRSQDQDRIVLEGVLYPDGRKRQTSSSLRSALWRANHVTSYRLIDSRGQRLRLADAVNVDLQSWTRRARFLTAELESDRTIDCSQLIETLRLELLPSWEEQWLVLERQRWDQVRLHALERLAERLSLTGRHVDALEAALAAVAIEPYRETAHRALISAYIAEGNCASALTQYNRCQRLLMHDLGVRPTSELESIIQRLTGR